MKKMMVFLLSVICLLPLYASAMVTAGLEMLPPGVSPVVMDEASVNGNLIVDRMEYDFYPQTVYRPVTYITHYADGGIKETRVVAKAMMTVTYTYYYGINKEGQYVFAGGNPEPTLGGFDEDTFEVDAQHVMDTSCNAVQLPNHAGYTYTFSGGYFMMTYNNVIHLDENEEIIKKEAVSSPVGIAYSCTFTIP